MSINLYNERLSGSLTSAVGSLPMLRSLELGRNMLGATIPIELARLTELTRLDLSDNRLIGTVPATFASLTKLAFLKLNGNALGGRLPTLTSSLTSCTVGDAFITTNCFANCPANCICLDSVVPKCTPTTTTTTTTTTTAPPPTPTPVAGQNLPCASMQQAGVCKFDAQCDGVVTLGVPACDAAAVRRREHCVFIIYFL